jgi:hypothetical protein
MPARSPGNSRLVVSSLLLIGFHILCLWFELHGHSVPLLSDLYIMVRQFPDFHAMLINSISQCIWGQANPIATIIIKDFSYPVTWLTGITINGSMGLCNIRVLLFFYWKSVVSYLGSCPDQQSILFSFILIHLESWYEKVTVPRVCFRHYDTSVYQKNFSTGQIDP